MGLALRLAEEAGVSGETPIGAVISCAGEFICGAANLRESTGDPLGHAEMRTISRASQILGRWRLEECTLYVTLEPCLMCAGAIMQARLGRLVFGASDPKAGAVCSLHQVFSAPGINHQPQILGRLMEQECSSLLKNFFRRLRFNRK